MTNNEPTCPHCGLAAIMREVTIRDEQYLRRIDEDGVPVFDETVDTTPASVSGIYCAECAAELTLEQVV